MTRDSELAALAGTYPRWEAWQSGMTGIWYARLRGTADEPVMGEDVTDLADSIERAERLAVVGELPVRHLDRIRRAHPSWTVQHVMAGHGWTAHRGEARLWAATLTDLETQLREGSG